MPRVSIIVPVFNCAGFLGRAIDTALSQTYTDYEVLVADDGSTDGTRDVVARYGSRVRYLWQSNRGVSAARNLAVSKATGELIAYLDADDMWYPQKLERQVAFLDTHKDCGFVHSEVSVINEADEVVHARFNSVTGRAVPQGHCLLALLRRCHIQTVTVLERRDCYDRAGGFDERVGVAEDYLHWIMIAMERMAVGYLAEPLAMYRWRGGSLSRRHRALSEGLAQVYEILWSETSVGRRCGPEAAEILRDQHYAARREVAYLDRVDGRKGRAFGRIISLICERPRQRDLYVDLLKTCIPTALGVRLRKRLG
jgi:glycosyltransferase involved in cell wall biosynthesis